jgi:c-di-GMP-binding flagellar brake protein YcgR
MAENRDNANAPEIVSDPARIASMMERLFRGRTSLTITLPGSNIRSKSIILDLNPKMGRFLINKFQSASAHQILLEQKRFYAYSQVDGIEIRFSSSLINVLSEGDDLYYLISIPDKIDYHQRRSFHRVCLNHMVIPVLLKLDDKTTLEGQMDDISAGGVSLLFTADLPSSLQIGALVRQCMFKIPDGEEVKCELRVCFINDGQETSLPKIGAQFVNIDKSLLKTIHHFVMSLERQQLKENTAE